MAVSYTHLAIYKFLSITKIHDYDDLNTLFFQVLARDMGSRTHSIMPVSYTHLARGGSADRDHLQNAGTLQHKDHPDIRARNPEEPVRTCGQIV